MMSCDGLRSIRKVYSSSRRRTDQNHIRADTPPRLTIRSPIGFSPRRGGKPIRDAFNSYRERFFYPKRFTTQKDSTLVTTREVLEQLTLPNLKKVAKRLGIQIPQGLAGFLAQAGLGVELRRPYIEALSSSGLVSLEEIDRILKTHYARLEEDGEEVKRPSERVS